MVCDDRGSFRSLEASGHAGFAGRGHDIVCAAETCILRTALQVLEQTEGVLLNKNDASRGTLAFSVEVKSSSQLLEERLKCTADFIRAGIKGLAEEYPEHVLLREKKEN